MTLRELSKLSGYTPQTIKFFLREKLLKSGAKVNERLAEYDESHAERLRLIRALHDKTNLTYDEVKAITEEIDRPGENVYNVLGLLQWQSMPKHAPQADTTHLQALLANHGIKPAHSLYTENLAGALTEAREEGLDFDDTVLATMIEAIKKIVEVEMDSDVPHLKSPDAIVRYSALGMYYTSSISRQLMRIIEQTMAREAMQLGNPKQERS